MYTGQCVRHGVSMIETCLLSEDQTPYKPLIYNECQNRAWILGKCLLDDR